MVDLVVKGVLINLLGFGTTLLGIATLAGTLVAQTITNATTTAIVTSVNDVYSPILVLDVFLVQAATNTLLGHFLSLVCGLWLLNIVGEGRGLRFQVRCRRYHSTARTTPTVWCLQVVVAAAEHHDTVHFAHSSAATCALFDAYQLLCKCFDHLKATPAAQAAGSACRP